MTEASDAADMRAIVEQYAEDVALLTKFHSLPMCEADLDRKKAFFESRRAALGTIDFDALDSSGRVDFLLLRARLDYELGEAECERRRWRQAAPLVPFAGAIVELERQRRELAEVDPQASAARLAELAGQVDRIREEVDKNGRESFTSGESSSSAKGDGDGGERRPLSLARRAAKITEKLREALKQWYTFYGEYDPLLVWWAEAPYQKADKALEAYLGVLNEKILGAKEGQDAPIVGDPIGAEALANELAFAMIPYTPEELIAIGERELAWCDEQMLQAAGEMGCGEDVSAALEKVKDDHVPPGRQPQLVRDLAREAERFLEERDLVTVPSLAREMWQMVMIPPDKQKVNPFFWGGQTIGVSFPGKSMAHDEKRMSLRGNNVHFARATVHHELIPGHHLQGFMARRHRPYRGVFRTPFFVEGWALYWEMLLWELDFAQSLANRVGMLFWRRHRAARIVFSLRFHLGEMSARECIDYLVKRVGHEPANAEGEVRRSFNGDYPPLYQCAYMLGGLQVFAMKRELVDTGRMTFRQFHDALLRQGSIPLELVRAALTGQDLSEDFQPSWRFAEA